MNLFRNETNCCFGLQAEQFGAKSSVFDSDQADSQCPIWGSSAEQSARVPSLSPLPLNVPFSLVYRFLSFHLLHIKNILDWAVWPWALPLGTNLSGITRIFWGFIQFKSQWGATGTTVTAQGLRSCSQRSKHSHLRVQTANVLHKGECKWVSHKNTTGRCANEISPERKFKKKTKKIFFRLGGFVTLVF